MMLNIVVCAKQIPDPEAPASAYRIDFNANKVLVPSGTPPVINPFDENALEAALCIKDVQPCKITVISAGRNLSKAVLAKSLAAGADELILLQDEAFENLDSYTIALLLSTAIRKAGMFDLILAGRQAADWDAGQVGIGIAELLDLPSITIARKVEVNVGKVKVERVVESGCQIVESSLPAVITVGNEVGELRTAELSKIMAARKQAVITWNAQDLGISLSNLNKSSLLRLFLSPHETKCVFIKGANPADIGSNLAIRLREIGAV